MISILRQMWSIHLFGFSKSSKKVKFLFLLLLFYFIIFFFSNHQSSLQATTKVLCIYELVAFYFKDSMYNRYSSFQVWLVSPSIMHSRSSHVVRNGQDFTFYGWINTLVSVCVCVCVFLYPVTHWLTQVTSMSWLF